MKMYTTNDIYLAAFLVASGNELESCIQQNGRTVFRLVEKDGLNDEINNYYSGRGMVSGLKMNNSLKNLKNFIYTNMNIYGKQRQTTIKG